VKALVMADRRADLESFTASLRRMLDDDPDNETFFEPGVARCVLEALEGFKDGTHRTLDDAFDLKRRRGRPKDAPGSGQYFKIAIQIDDMRARGLSWTKIAEAIPSRKGFEAKEIRDIYQRNAEAIIQYRAKEIARGVARRARRRSLVVRKRPRRV
jgi:hypothetical protein